MDAEVDRDGLQEAGPRRPRRGRTQRRRGQGEERKRELRMLRFHVEGIRKLVGRELAPNAGLRLGSMSSMAIDRRHF